MEKGTLFDSASSVFTTKTTVTSGFFGMGAGLYTSISQMSLTSQIGLAIAVLSLIFTVVSFVRSNRRAEELHQAKLLKIREGKDEGGY